MKRLNEFGSPLIREHASIALEGTNNTIFQMADLAKISDRKVVFPLDLKEILGIPHHINNWYEYKVGYGVYERFYQLTVISLCSDIEFMFKNLFSCLNPHRKYRSGFFQRFNNVISDLEDMGFDFNSIQQDIKNLEKGFNIRHISVHNMGYVDQKFKEKVSTAYLVNERFEVTSDIFKETFESYGNLLEVLDNFLVTKQL